MTVLSAERRLAGGAELQNAGGTHLRVWAPACATLEVVLARDTAVRWRMTPEGDGHHSVLVPELAAGDRYWYALDADRLRPDPWSRAQPEGPHGPSEIVDPGAFAWTDQDWRGTGRDGQVLYELHVGTFTPAGTWRAAIEELPALARLGITVIEMMPVAEFPGRFGWGYDGVDLYAPTRLYGRPDDFRAFVDRAHGLGLAVILDVVYNHLGPDGNYLSEFSPDYFTDKYKNDWGRAINFEGPAAAREFFVANAGYWIDEFHVDGLRIDATQDIHDSSREHVLRSMTARGARRRRPPQLLRRRRERAAEHRIDPGPRHRRLRDGRALERRLPSHRGGRADRAPRSVLSGLRRFSAGAALVREVRLSVSGPVLRVAEEAPRHAVARRRCGLRSSPTWRTTTRSRTPRSAVGSTSWRRRAGTAR